MDRNTIEILNSDREFRDVNPSNQEVALPITTKGVTAFIERILRISEGMNVQFIDTKGCLKKINTLQNHLIVGRRGVGKSAVLIELKRQSIIAPYLNLEDLKDITFPNVLTRVLEKLFSEIANEINQSHTRSPILRIKQYGLKRKLRRLANELSRNIFAPDEELEEVESEESTNKDSSGQLSRWGANLKIYKGKSHRLNVRKKLKKDKINILKMRLPEYKSLLCEIAKLHPGAPIFLCLDDFYFVPKGSQVYLIDYLHRLTKDTPLYLKVASNKTRTNVYERNNEEIFGVEVGHDIIEVELGFSFVEFRRMKDHFRKLLEVISKRCNIPLSIHKIFGEGAFDQLCLSSGGITREFLSLFNALLIDFESSKLPIEKNAIIEVAREFGARRVRTLHNDSRPEAKFALEIRRSLRQIVCIQAGTNAFFVSTHEIESSPSFSAIIEDLCDLGMIHLVITDSKQSLYNSERYNLYFVDVSLYDSVKALGFRQVEHIPPRPFVEYTWINFAPIVSFADLKVELTKIKSYSLRYEQLFLENLRDQQTGSGPTDGVSS